MNASPFDDVLRRSARSPVAIRLKGKLPHLLLRADADQARGAGHVMRCLALAEAWQQHDGRATLLSCRLNPELCRRTEALGIGLTEIPLPHPASSDLRAACTVLEEVSRDDTALPWVVLDGHHFDTVYQSLLRSAGCRLMVIDDTAHLLRYDADMILNQTLSAQQFAYTCSPDTLLLLGTRFALLRSEFHRWHGTPRHCPEVARKILVTLGGSDADNATLKIIETLEQISTPDLEVRVVVGPLNSHLAQLQSRMDSKSSRIRLETDATDIASLMAWADLAVAGGGTTAWELAFMKVPALVLTLSENQSEVARALDEFGTARSLGSPSDLDQDQLAEAIFRLMHDRGTRQQMSEKGRVVVDGGGAERALEVMLCGSRGSSLQLRVASEEDMLLLWQWANEAATRRNSFSSEPISWVSHQAWYAAKLMSSDTRLWVLELQKVPVGQIRYERTDPRTARISFSIAPAYRGMGLGTQLLSLSADRAGRELRVDTVEGITFAENRASNHAFLNAGFGVVEERHVAGHRCFVFRRSCSLRGAESDGIIS
jgi:UDP-2,4-diacetamido-2,4,6-trideoxy-beta-L-altropyranose hydrolase